MQEIQEQLPETPGSPEASPKKQKWKLRFVGFSKGTYIKLALYAAALLFEGLNWKVYDTRREGYRWAEMIYTGIWFAVLALVLFWRVETQTKKQQVCWQICLVVAAAFCSYYQIEMLGFNVILKEEIQALFINWVLILVLYLLGYVLTNRFGGAVLFGTLLCFALAVTNHLVFLFRGTPFLPNDIYAAETAMSVMNQLAYEITPETFLGVLPMLVNFGLAGHMTWHSSEKKTFWRTKILGGAAVVGIALLCVCTDILLHCGTTISYWNTVKSANANGELMQFIIYIRKSQVEKPADYSVDAVQEIYAQYSGKAAAAEEQPNVIVIMNEAWSDLSVIKEFETNEEYMPFYNTLQENCIKGDMICSIKGGGTCNTEFEFITGNTNAFLPQGCLPYQQYIRANMPSMGWVMGDDGYQVLAAHPYHATGWRRSTVYPLLGLPEFSSLDDYPYSTPKGRLRLVTDYGNYKYLISRFEEKEAGSPMFIFNVTMQNHSGYSTDYDFADRITLPEYPEAEYLNAEIYLSLMKQTDSAFQYLIEHFEKEEEPTIIVMFGDHQPGDMNAFLDMLSADLDDSLQDLSKLYTVPYIIWANYDISEAAENWEGTEQISANYLSSMVMELAGVEMPAYNSFLLELREEFPVVSSKICIDADGNYMTVAEALEQSEIMRQYRLLQYNNLFDLKNRDDLFFYGTQRKAG